MPSNPSPNNRDCVSTLLLLSISDTLLLSFVSSAASICVSASFSNCEFITESNVICDIAVCFRVLLRGIVDAFAAMLAATVAAAIDEGNVGGDSGLRSGDSAMFRLSMTPLKATLFLLPPRFVVRNTEGGDIRLLLFVVFVADGGLLSSTVSNIGGGGGGGGGGGMFIWLLLD